MRQNDILSQMTLKQIFAAAIVSCSIALTIGCSNATGYSSQQEEAVVRMNPLALKVKESQIFNGNEGRAVIQLDGYFIEINFQYEKSTAFKHLPADYQIISLEPVSIYDSQFNSYEDFTDQYDHKNLATALKQHLDGNI